MESGARVLIESKLTGKGASAQKSMTVIDVFRTTVELHPQSSAIAFLEKENPQAVVWTWAEYWEQCRKFAKTLIKLNLHSSDVVNILGSNAPQWLIAYTGAMMASCVPAGIYPTNSSHSCDYILLQSKAKVVVLDTNEQLSKYATMNRTSTGGLSDIVVWGEPIDETIAAKLTGIRVSSWESFLESGAAVSDQIVEDRLAAILPENCATIIFTSGTTGNPKGVMLSHDNVTWTSKIFSESYFKLDQSERVLSFLPLSHIAAQCVDILVPLWVGSTTFFWDPKSLQLEFLQAIQRVRPTLFLAIPRVWEKLSQKVAAVEGKRGGFEKLLIEGAKWFALQHAKICQYQNPKYSDVNLVQGISNWLISIGNTIADRLILGRIRVALGLDQSKACLVGASPIHADTLWYLASLGIPVYEVFGQSESSGPHTISFPGAWKIGTCGRPLIGTESKVDPETGELLCKGRHIFMGYMNMPEETAKSIDKDGFFHTGDMAIFDGDDDPQIAASSGFMTITGRIKELIITSGGENISPTLIENAMLQQMPALARCIVVGNNKNYLTMLVVLKTADDVSGSLSPEALAVGHKIGSEAKSVAEVAADPLWTQYIAEGLAKANEAAIARPHWVRKWRLLPRDLSEAAGELTVTSKVKRSVVAEHFKDLIESMYSN